uniref:DUF262 domain-containing protein n=1 Tax=Oceanivirga salmonicida TaxID=1769291 RepID=UPI000834E98E
MDDKTFMPSIWSVEKLFNRVFEIPVYQRPYSWDKEEVETLINDIIDSYIEDNKQTYYVGNILIKDKREKINGEFIKYEIIDGQQRITTLNLILLALYTLIDKDSDDEVYINIRNLLWKKLERKNIKDLRTMNLGNLEQEYFENLYNECFIEKNNIMDTIENIKKTNIFTIRIKNNFLIIRNIIKERIMGNDIQNLYKFSDFLLAYIKVLAIEIDMKMTKIFSIFESINSKGKKLEEIDLIKSYIFSVIDFKKHDIYLKKWGQLIEETEDNLEDYLYVYIKSFVKFYRQNIKIKSFKDIIKNKLKEDYGIENDSCVFEKLLDDMLKQVKYYKMLTDINLSNKLINNNVFKFYHKACINLSYNHPKPLFMRLFSEYAKGYIEKNDLIEIVKEISVFMFKFITIVGLDSKDVIELFSDIMGNIYEKEIDESIDKEKIKNLIALKLNKENIDNELLHKKISTYDAYSKSNVTNVLLSLYQSLDKDRVSYDKANLYLLDKDKISIGLDHLMPQNPNPNDIYLKYYVENKKLILKDCHDFPKEFETGQNYEDFKNKVLNKI